MLMRSRLKTCFDNLEYSSEEVVERSEAVLDICGTGGDGSLWGRDGEEDDDDVLDIRKDSAMEDED
jgi:hypothetical protein